MEVEELPAADLVPVLQFDAAVDCQTLPPIADAAMLAQIAAVAAAVVDDMCAPEGYLYLSTVDRLALQLLAKMRWLVVASLEEGLVHRSTDWNGRL